MDDCIFCKIATSKIPCHIILEDNNFIAFLDIRPFTIGHTLVIPKSHFRWTYNVPNFGEYWEFVFKVTQKIQKTINPIFVSYLTLGNQVEHAHIHIIPRYTNDNLSDSFGENLRLDQTTDELTELVAKINS